MRNFLHWLGIHWYGLTLGWLALCIVILLMLQVATQGDRD